MGNQHKGEVAFSVGEKRYVVQFTIDAICTLEAETGKGIVALITDLQDPEKMSIGLVRQVFWAGLLEHQPEITVKEAGELIPAVGGMFEVIKLFDAAFALSFPSAKASTPNPRKAGSPKMNGIGPHSTGRGARSGATTKPSGERPPAKSA